MEWYIAVIRQYAVFTGRARRKEYWMFFLFNLIFSLIAGVLDGFFGTVAIGTVYGVAVLVPGIAVTVRRLHDTGRSGWWALIALIPFIGTLVLIVLTIFEGDKGSNEYGPDPKASDAAYNPS
ncbi:Inner membrane protein YhaH [Vibrio aerogenes CECT 7868]|uniref:Inner membrane protein YhaH n=1 Tax=Vibrio aerogenes CECT 7868 TaxID=1216006 RepID=A0A1M5Z3X9_9VIBR|nr:DUF805 domain-containing protein [Vibrio aerogenes]SHI18945.1 Inner membrane protein YhaH [Vibrio aerogenes CECT 7868]